MFKPIIHNLKPGAPGYAEYQFYNNLVANKPNGPGTLASKIAKQRAWKDLCNLALEKAHLTLKGI
jgi:hypothetical protein